MGRGLPARTLVVALVLATLGCLTACAPGAPRAPSAGTDRASEGSQPKSSRASRTLVTAIRGEPVTLASRVLSRGITTTTTRRLFNANLVIFDQAGAPHPYLAAELPRLQTDSWRVSSDGGMETTYKLKKDLAWHDGSPLTADDFVFSASVYATPEVGTSNSPPNNLIGEVRAPDPLTLVIRWKRPYAEAGRLTEDFPPLPRHALEIPFQSLMADAFRSTVPFCIHACA